MSVPASSILLGSMEFISHKVKPKSKLGNKHGLSQSFWGGANASAKVVALEEGRSLHEHLIESGCWSDVFVGNSLVDMCLREHGGCLERVRQDAIM